MNSIAEFMKIGSSVDRHRPWPRTIVDTAHWNIAATHLTDGHWVLLGLWGEPEVVHLAILDESTGDIGVVSFNCLDRGFPSVGQYHPPAIRLERTVHDLFGLKPQGLHDVRPWLDHGRWGVLHPLARKPRESHVVSHYEFQPVEGEALHQIPVGPVHAGIIEPGHFRFTASGETVVRLEERLGYVHKGIEGLMTGADLNSAVKLVGRVSGDSTVAYALAFALAAEAALDFDAPPRSRWIRAIMAELERLANHIGDIGAICNDAAFSLMHTHCSILRENILRVSDLCFGHRLMRDRIVPGGIACDLSADGAVALRALLREVRRRFPELIELYDNTASLQDRTVTTGILDNKYVRQFGAGGYVGRASGRAFDARRVVGYPPYDVLNFEVPVLTAGDVNSRVWIRIREIEQSLRLVEQTLDNLPHGSVRADLTLAPAEGMALVEGFRGDVLIWLRLDGTGRIERCHMRDPSWFQWPLLEAAIDGNIVADFPLCNKSFNCSYSGHDL